MEVIRVVADTAPSSGKGVRYGSFGEGGVTAMVVDEFIELGAKELLLKVVHEQVSIGGGHTGAHDHIFVLEEMSGVEGEIVVGRDKLCELEEESSGWLGVGRALVQEMYQGREAMGMADVDV